MGILAALVVLLTTACSFTAKDPDYVTPAPPSPLEQLKQVPVTQPSTLAAGEGFLAFVTPDRNAVCAMTTARGEHINLPYETNSYSDPSNNKLATVPVVHCELATYPKPEPGDVKDDCAGTGLGYLGGTVLLTPEKAVYGECRSGVTEMEAEFGPEGSRKGPISELPVLEEGQNIERNGLRCSAYNGGVACGNVTAGVAFFVSRNGYQLTAGESPTAGPTSPATSGPTGSPTTGS